MAMAIELLRASSDQRPLVERLMQFYFYDFSEWAPLPFGDDATFSTPEISTYWERSDRHPFLVRCDERIAGFALIDGEVSDARSQFNLGHFFIGRHYRRKGVGRAAARELFKRYPGRWEIYQFAANKPATAFWRAVIAECCGDFEELELEIAGIPCVQQRFDSRGHIPDEPPTL